jgi:hypothetical protein
MRTIPARNGGRPLFACLTKYLSYKLQAKPVLLVDVLKPRDLFRFAVSPKRWVCVCVDVDAKNRPIGNLPQWYDLLSDLEAAFRSRFIADDGQNELQKSGGSNSRKQVVQLSSRSISAGNLVFSS